MLEFLGKAIIEYIEKELLQAAPGIEKAVMEQLESFVEMIAEFLGLKAESLKGLKKPESLEASSDE